MTNSKPDELLGPPTDLWERIAARITAKPVERARDAEWKSPLWREVAPGISCKILAQDATRNRIAMLVPLAPGVEYPPHTHADTEELHLLAGELWIGDRKLRPGDYNRADAGSIDVHVWTETGCTCALITSTKDILR